MRTDLVDNPFGNQLRAPRASSAMATASAEQQRAIAEVQASMMVAQSVRRDPVRATERLLNACTRQALAEQALYSYSRGGAEVSGPSIRLAESAAQSWGNLSFGIRELEQSEGSSSVQAFCHDLETNVRREVVFSVPHIRYKKSGAVELSDPRDIYEMVANQGARRLRACILAVIPGDVIEAAVLQCDATLKANADTTPEGLRKIVEAFERFGVSREQIEARVQCRLEAIRPAQVVSLKKIYASLRDEMSKPADWFEVEATDDEAERSIARAEIKRVDPEKAIRPNTRPEPRDEERATETASAGATGGHPSSDGSDANPAPEKAAPAPKKPYIDENGEWRDASGAVWNPEIHATAKEGGPSFRGDGTFRARRGVQPAPQQAPPEPEQQPQRQAPSDPWSDGEKREERPPSYPSPTFAQIAERIYGANTNGEVVDAMALIPSTMPPEFIEELKAAAEKQRERLLAR